LTLPVHAIHLTGPEVPSARGGSAADAWLGSGGPGPSETEGTPVAHTPMLSILERMADLGHAARRQGVDLEEAEARQRTLLASDDGISRRGLLKRAAVTAAAATAVGRIVLQPEHAWAAARPTSQPRIAIVGAGISGLSAAMTLRDAGFSDITIFDAGNRIGGRTFTRRDDGFFESGQWAEWGGELIDSSHKTVFALCRRFGFRTIDLASQSVSTNGAADTLWFGGGYYPWDQMVRDWKASGVEQVIQKQMQALPPWPWPYSASWSPAALAISQQSVAGWIDTNIPGGRASRLGSFIDVAYNIEFGEQTSGQSALNLLGLLGTSTGGGGGAWWVYGKSDERWKIVGGNQQIAEAQADFVGRGNIQLGWRLVSSVRNANGTATATFDVDGATHTVTADRLILAVPLGVMKAIKAAGGFAGSGFDNDPRKMGSIDALGFGANNKLQLQIADRFWCKPGPWGNTTGESYADTGYQEAWAVTAGQPGVTGILNNYTGGDVSQQLSPARPFSDTGDPSPPVAQLVRDAASGFLRQIEPVHPGLTAKYTGKAQLSAWHVNPNSLGSYSFWTPGYCERFCTVERVPARPIHFAGEHCSQDFQGYIQGGADEGIRAASEVIADFK
jgi:monoamine oxidase